MTQAKQMLEAHPRQPALEMGPLLRCIESCFECAQSCTACADACLGESDVGMLVACIRRCLDCGDVCGATGRILSRQTEFSPQVAGSVVQACSQACRACAEECERRAFITSTVVSAPRFAADANRRAQSFCLMTCNDWRLDLRLATMPLHFEGWVQFSEGARHCASRSIGEVCQEFFVCPARTSRSGSDVVHVGPAGFLRRRAERPSGASSRRLRDRPR